MITIKFKQHIANNAKNKKVIGRIALKRHLKNNYTSIAEGTSALSTYPLEVISFEKSVYTSLAISKRKKITNTKLLVIYPNS